ncbi:MAG TPA: hypothetical protein ENO22_14320 [candidate division Zixibacteria bacterium]|nr:hypothetical protein [candidate division Zixibacteria bacterium]HER00508.1 hypothetical protein [candidate division Zixibacteria bacterium]
MKRLKVIIFCLLPVLLNTASKSYGFDIFPEVVGNGVSDSIILTFETFDTTALPLAADPDSLKILRFGPDGSLVDSLGEDASSLENIRVGSYTVHFRGSDGSGTKGRYLIRVYAYVGDEIRGAASAGYYVKSGNWDDLDSAKLYAKAILDTLQDGFASQTNQANLDVPVSSCGAGSGAYPCSLYVFSSADSSALQGISLRFMNSSQTATEAVGLSNSEGLVVASLDEAIYRVWAYKAGIEFEGLPDSVNMLAPSTVDTIWGSGFDPGQPVSPELCRIYGWVFDLSGYAIAGVTVMARLNESPVSHDGSVISPYYRTASTDSTGYWYLDLIPSDNLEPVCEYEIVIYHDSGRIARKSVAVPDQASWELDW